MFVLDLNSCVKIKTGTWALTLQKRVGGEQVHEESMIIMYIKMDQFLSHATVNNKNRTIPPITDDSIVL